MEQQTESPPYEDGDYWVHWRLLYNTNLDPGKHTVECNVLSASTDQPFYFDNFVIYPSDLSGILLGDITEPSTSSGSTTTSPKETSSPTQPTAASSPKKGGAPTAAIVGGVIGVLLLLSLVTAGLVLFWRRRKREPYAQVGGYDDDGTRLFSLSCRKWTHILW